MVSKPQPNSLAGHLRRVLKEKGRATIDQLASEVGPLVSAEAALSRYKKLRDSPSRQRRRPLTEDPSRSGEGSSVRKPPTEDEMIASGRRRILACLLATMAHRGKIRRTGQGVYALALPNRMDLTCSAIAKAAKKIGGPFTAEQMEGFVGKLIPAARAARRFNGFIRYEKSRNKRVYAQPSSLDNNLLIGRKLIVKDRIGTLLANGTLTKVRRGLYVLTASKNGRATTPPPIQEETQ